MDNQWKDISMEELIKNLKSAYDKLSPMVEIRERLQKKVNQNNLVFLMNYDLCVSWGIYPRIEFEPLKIQLSEKKWITTQYYGQIVVDRNSYIEVDV